jgi:hypothetical protein
MTTRVREPGTYRTTSGVLIHLRPSADGVVVEREDAPSYGRAGGDERLVKLSDDPDWPDIQRHVADPELFAD